MPHAAFCELAREAVRRSGMADGYIRLVVTRGPGALGVSPHTCAAPTVILMVAPLALYSPEAYANGIVLVTSSLRRSAADALPAQAKTLNYLTSVLASIEARRQGADEAILLNGEGIVAECTADNLFVVSGGRVVDAVDIARRALGHHARARASSCSASSGSPATSAP